VTVAGELALWLAFLLALWSGALSLLAVVTGRDDLAESGVRGIHGSLIFTAGAVAVLLRALVVRDFSMRYVATHTSLVLPDRLAVAALWAGPGGSLLLWALVLAAAASVAVVHARREREALPWIGGTLAAVLALFLGSALFDAHPFESLGVRPPEGRGLRPELQSDAFLVHPPLIAAGAALSAVPFALTVAALGVGRADASWSRRVRSWSAVAWALLTGGLVVGARWAAELDGWGPWLRDPVQGVWLLPWLSGALLVHSNPAWSTAREGRALRALLAVATFVLAGAGVALMRSGVTDSPHSFAFSASGATLAVLPMAAIAGAVSLAARRRSALAALGQMSVDDTPSRIGAWLTRAGLILMVFGLAGTAARRSHVVTLGDAEIFHAKDPFGHQWSLTSQGRSTFRHENYEAVAVALLPSRDGTRQPMLTAALRTYVDVDDRVLFDRVPALASRSTAFMDTRLTLLDADSRRARLRLTFVPLGSWPWLGGALLAVGALAGLAARRMG